MKFFRSLAVVLVAVLMCVNAFAQSSTTGALVGTVTTGGNPLPGATVTITSPNLQGSRTAVTDVNGNYSMSALPSGDYTVKIELSGLSTATKTVHVGLSSTGRVDADLKVSAVAEAITVTASAPAVLETTEVQANYQKKLVDQLPLSRTVTGIALLAPGVVANGPRNAVQISGGFASDSLINVDGSNVQENLRGQARPLFIEDAIQETSVMTAGVSAEYGRFTGGVINAITKSGGNEFSGSFRDSLTNPKWISISRYGVEHPGTEAPPNTLNNVYEATLGGRIIRDRLWFFGAGRYSKTTNSGGSFLAGGPEFFQSSKNQRLEAKLTGQVTSKHSLQVTFLNSPLVNTNDNQLGVFEPQALDPSISQKEDFKSAHYNGVITNNLLLEGNYSKRRFVFVGFGGDNPDPYQGTPLRQLVGESGTANAAYFCGICDREHRDNQVVSGKATYFLGTKSLGTHNLVGGLEQYKEFRLSNNFQSASNFVVYTFHQPAKRVNGQVLFTLTEGDELDYWPVEFPSTGSNIKTTGEFVNDKWDLNSHWSFNLGLRHDKNNAVDSFGNVTSKDSSFSPRLGAIYDVMGNGRVRVNASYGKYVGRLAETVAGSGSKAGDPADYWWYWEGPDFTGTSAQVVKTFLDQFFAAGGTNFTKHPYAGANIGGFSKRLASDNLKSPGMREYTAGVGFQIGPNGYLRADYIDRDWNNYYVTYTTGTQVTGPLGDIADLSLVDNTDLLTRTYKAVQLQAQYRLFQRLNVGANYTYSKLRGNAEGEGTAGGPQSEGGWIFEYPEYQGFAQNRPTGYLSGDQRHKGRAWAGMDFALGPVGRLNLSAIERIDSGRPYSAAVTTLPTVLNPAVTTKPVYASAPTQTTYFFSGRGQFRFPTEYRTDLALNYTFPISRAELFFEGEAFNIFNEQKILNANTTVIIRSSSLTGCPQGTGANLAQATAGTPGATPGRCDAFNPFTMTPVLGKNYAYGPTFGQARSKADYETPREYRFSVGLRF